MKRDVKVQLVQSAPVLGDVSRNLEAHLEAVEAARDAGADLVVFPELSLTGYFLRDLTSEVALAIDSGVVERLAEAAQDISVCFGMVEEADDHRLFNAQVFCEDGRVLQTHRKVYLPTYGLFEEGRYLAPGDSFAPVDSRLGRFGLLVCEDLWHLSSSYLHFLNGVDAIVCVSAAPGRGVTDPDGEISTARSWNLLLETQALFFQLHTVYVNRVGFEDGVLFWGGTKVVSPFGRVVAEAEGQDEAVVSATLEAGALRRARTMTPTLRDEKSHLVLETLMRMRHGNGPEEPSRDSS